MRSKPNTIVLQGFPCICGLYKGNGDLVLVRVLCRVINSQNFDCLFSYSVDSHIWCWWEENLSRFFLASGSATSGQFALTRE